MTNRAPCKHGCGTRVGSDEQTCPTCGGAYPHPESRPTGAASPLERGCLIVMIVGGLFACVALLMTKLIVG